MVRLTPNNTVFIVMVGLHIVQFCLVLAQMILILVNFFDQTFMDWTDWRVPAIVIDCIALLFLLISLIIRTCYGDIGFLLEHTRLDQPVLYTMVTVLSIALQSLLCLAYIVLVTIFNTIYWSKADTSPWDTVYFDFNDTQPGGNFTRKVFARYGIHSECASPPHAIASCSVRKYISDNHERMRSAATAITTIYITLT